MKAIWTNCIIEFKLFYRNFMNVFFTIAFPLMLLFIFGEIFGNEASVTFNNRGTVDASVPGYIIMIICVTGLMTMPITLSSYREKKILKFYKTTPIGVPKLIGTQFVVNIFMTVVSIILLLAAAEIVYDITFDGAIWQAIICVFISILSLFSMGFFITAISPNTKITTAVANILYFPMIFLSGATMPIEILPDSLKRVAAFIPTTYAVKLLNGVFRGDNFWNYKKEMLLLVLVFIAMIGLSIKFFKWESR